MGFDDLVSRANSAAINRLGGEDFIVKLNGATIDTIQGIFDEAVETISPHDADTVVVRPAVAFLDEDYDGFGKSHTYTRIKTGIAYRIFGDIQTDGTGMTVAYLVKA
jgi:hypothetical protein